MTKFDLGVKWVKINQGHNLNNLDNTCVPDGTYKVHRSSGSREEDSSERPKKREVDLEIPGLVVLRVIHYTNAVPRR